MEVNGKPKDSTEQRTKKGAVTGRRRKGGTAARFLRSSLVMVLTTTMIATGVGGLIPNPLSQQLSETLAEVLPEEVAATVDTLLTQSNLPPIANKESANPSPGSNTEAPTFIDSMAILFNSNAVIAVPSVTTPSGATFLDSLVALLTGESFPAPGNPAAPTFLDALLSLTSGEPLPLDTSSQQTFLDSIISAVTGDSIPSPEFASSSTFLDQIVSLVKNEPLVSPGGNSTSDISSESTFLDSLIGLVFGTSVDGTNNPLNPGDVILSWLFPPASEPQLPSEQDIVDAAMTSVQQTQTQFVTMTSLASSPTLASTQTSVPTLTPNPSPSATTSPIPTATVAWILPTSTKPPPPLPTSTFTPTITPTFTPAPPCSISSSTAANVTFTNSSSTETVNIYWVDYACNVTFFATLAPGQSLGVGTSLTHAWRFANAYTSQLIRDYVVSAPGTLDIWTGSFSISGDFSVSSVSLNGGGSSIVVAPGQTVNVTYNFNIWDDSCPGCITQLVTGLGTAGTHGGSCAFAGDAGLYPGTSGVENINLTAPLTPGIYNVAVSYQWQFTCAQALSAYAGGRTIGQIEVQAPPIILYEGGTSTGNIGPRATADAICTAGIPSGFSNARAFIGYSAADSIANMPSNYGIPTNVPIQSVTSVVIANDWADLTDGTIATSLNGAGLSGSQWWSGAEDASGSFIDGVTVNCLEWTSNLLTGVPGFFNDPGIYWIRAGIGSCTATRTILCVGY